MSESDPFIDYSFAQLIAERRGQLEGAKLVLRPLVFMAVIGVFVLSYWRYRIGLFFSVGAAILTLPLISLAFSLPVGYILGKRASRRFRARISNFCGEDPKAPT
jgi:hypothetical protein